MNHRVVVTGWGVISSIGHTAASFWSNLSRGASGIADATTISTEGLIQKVVAEVKDYQPTNHFEARVLPAIDRGSQFAVIASREAIKQSGLSFEGGLSERTATIVGTGAGGQGTIDESYRKLYGEGAKRMHPLTVPKLMVNAPASQVSMNCGLRGPTFVVASACASATHAMGLAFHGAGRHRSGRRHRHRGLHLVRPMKIWEALKIMARHLPAIRATARACAGRRRRHGGAGSSSTPRLANILGDWRFRHERRCRRLLAPDVGGMSRAVEAFCRRQAGHRRQYINAQAPALPPTTSPRPTQ